MDFVNQQYWDEGYSNLSLEFSNADDPIVQLINSTIEQIEKGDVFEIGCFPGRYLKVFGEKGFVLHGVDTTPRVATDLVTEFNRKKFSVGEFIQGNIFDLKLNKHFDIVCSFGFIEHFINWQEAIACHLRLVKKGGIIIITVPNFSGIIPNRFHKHFDRINFNRHNIQSMNLSAWKTCLRKLPCEYEVLFEGPIGRLDLWADQEKRSKWKSFILGKIFNAVNVFRKWNLPVSKTLFTLPWFDY